MPRSRKNNIVFIKQSERPSRFLLDLKMPSPAEVKVESEKKLKIAAIRQDKLKEFFVNKKDTWQRLAIFPILAGFGILILKIIPFAKRAVTAWRKRISISAEKNKINRTNGDQDDLALIFNHKIPVPEKKPFTLFSRKSVRVSQPIETNESEQIIYPSAKKRNKFKWRMLLPRPSLQAFRSTVSLAIILAILILPLKALTYYKDLKDMRGRVLGVSETALGQLSSASTAAKQFDFNQAGREFGAASYNFDNAQQEIGNLTNVFSVLALVLPGQDIKMAANANLILEAARLSSLLGQELSITLADLAGGEQVDLKTILDSFNRHSLLMKEYASDLDEVMVKIDPAALPIEYQEKFNNLKPAIGNISASLDELIDLANKIKTILGFEYDSRYLLVFQNNNELRASGGFIGSYALIDFHNGQIKNIEVPGGGSYDTEAGLLDKIIAPEPLHLVNPLWHFWDANWWPDWPTSAKKLMWFLEKSDGPSVDGVLSFTPTAFERLLQVIGPIDMQTEYGVTITADNFWSIVQALAEQKPDFTKKPKLIIGDLMHKIINELPSRLNKEVVVSLIKVLENNFNEKQILFYFNNPDLQTKAVDLGWAGQIKNDSDDYLMVINSNIAGGKSDRKIRESIEHDAVVNDDGSIIDTVKIIREHTGEKGDEFTGVRNVDWLRVYVPAGSELLSARGFSQPGDWFFSEPDSSAKLDPDLASENNAKVDPASLTKTYAEAGKTVFANWSMIDPGQTATIYLKYKLPFNFSDISKNKTSTWWQELLVANRNLSPYALLVQKQPGSSGSNFKTTLQLPANYQTVWQYPDSMPLIATGWAGQTILDTDKFYSALLEIKN